jgi:hypothetical protein
LTKLMKQIGLAGICIVLLAACAKNEPADVDTLGGIEMINGEGHTVLSSGLHIDIFELEGPPKVEPLTFVPVGGLTQNEVLSLHEAERQLIFTDNGFFDENRFCVRSQGQGPMVTACEFATEAADGLGSLTIDMMVDDEVVFTAEAGDASPISPLRGVWSFDEDWVLEFAHITVTIDEDENTANSDAKGQLVWMGILVNETLLTDEIFGFQLMNGKPFYFFDKDGEIGIVFDEIVTPLGFEAVPHYGCCSAGMLNPRQAQNMVAFFAERDARWYYVEIGIFD